MNYELNKMRQEKRITPTFVISLEPNEVFVFGSNLQGMHSGGAAYIAHKKFGAQWGVGVGPTGKSYAIPTMHGGAEAIRPYAQQFLKYAAENPHKRFLLTRIGCGTAGHSDAEIANLFWGVQALSNVTVPREWLPYLFGSRLN